LSRRWLAGRAGGAASAYPLDPCSRAVSPPLSYTRLGGLEHEKPATVAWRPSRND